MAEINPQLKRLLDHWGIKDPARQLGFANRALKGEDIPDLMGLMKDFTVMSGKATTQQFESIYGKIEVDIYKANPKSLNDVFDAIKSMAKNPENDFTKSFVDDAIKSKNLKKGHKDRWVVDRLESFLADEDLTLPQEIEPQKKPTLVPDSPPNAALKKYFADIKKPGLAEKMANQKIEWNDLTRMFEASIHPKELTREQRRELLANDSPLHKPPYSELTWNQLFDPATQAPKLKLGNQEFDVLGSIRKGLADSINGRNEMMEGVMTKGFPSRGPIFPESGDPSSRHENWLPPPRRPAAPPANGQQKIDFHDVLKDAGVQTAILSRDDSAPPPPDVRTANRSLEV